MQKTTRVKFVADKEAIPSDYGYTDSTVESLDDAEISYDGFKFGKLNKKAPYGNHSLSTVGEYFKLT